MQSRCRSSAALNVLRRPDLLCRTLGGLLAGLVCLVVASAAGAQEGESGVSPTRLSLPQGPGSLEGIGENASVAPNMGLMTYGLPIEVPAGYGGLSPNLALQYASAGGQSVVGMGWSLSVPTIERMTDRGLPRYDADDRFGAAGGAELVEVATGASETTYRERFEGSFVRYTWVDAAGTGRRGYWIAEYPDGRVGYFGAAAGGELVDSATVLGPAGAFRYHLVELHDTLGHVVRYRYRKDGAVALLDRIQYVFEGGAARYSVHFDYEDRQDEISTAAPGFDVRLTQRLEDIEVRVRGQRLRNYALAYEPYETSGGFTQLAAVRQYGMLGGEPFPIAFTFEYSRGVGPGCLFPQCPAPVIRTLGATGVSLASGDADLIDMDGDALPDLLDSSDGSHVFFLSELEETGVQAFGDPRTSEVASGGAARLSSTAVQLLDVDGDGYSDLVDDDNGLVFFNVGDGDWAAPEAVNVDLPDMADPDARFVDLDGDRAIDVLFSDGETTWWVPNLGDGRFGEAIFPPRDLGVGFVRDGVQLADMNGDGLLDVVRLTQAKAEYRLSLGRGAFSDWIEMFGLPLLPSPLTALVDINGDSLADAVVYEGAEIAIWLNRNGRWFDEPFVIDTALGGSVPERTSDLTIRYADMNGSGSTDLVWVDASGRVSFLELYPERPHLLTRIENGIGAVQEITYGSSTTHMARDEGWSHRLPHPMQTVETLDIWDEHSGVHSVQEYAYHDGYYDPFERRFSGFAEVEVFSPGDASVEDGEVRYLFDVGVDDPYRRGLALRTEQLSGGRSIDVVEGHYDDCNVDDVSRSLEPAVRSICQVASVRTLREGLTDPSEWVTLEEEYEYDGYGNRTLASRLGVTAIGGAGCEPCTRPIGVYGAPCGGECLGDEAFEELVFIEPGDATGGRWMLRHACQRFTYGNTRNPTRTEENTYYDGDPFVGLGLCQLDRGVLTRLSARVAPDSDERIDVERHETGPHGELVATMDGNGHIRAFEYDAAGLQPLAEVVVLDDPGHEPYALRSTIERHPVLEQVIRSTSWALLSGGAEISSGHDTQYAYDEFSRIVAMARPGDTLDRPTEEYFYELASPLSRIVTRGRTGLGGPGDLWSAACFDGRGRAFQEITRLAPGSYQASGYVRPSRDEAPAAAHQPYTSADGDCAQAPPESSLAERYHYDALGRILTATAPDGDLYGAPSRRLTTYAPLQVVDADPIDADPAAGNGAYNTPAVTQLDGLGRTTRVEWFLGDRASSAPIALELAYTEHGLLRSTVDPLGREKAQTYDLLGRTTSVDDPDSGLTRYAYDAAGNQVSRTDALGIRIDRSYDEAGRLSTMTEAGGGELLVAYSYDRDEQCPIDCRNAAGLTVGARYSLGPLGGAAEWSSYDSRGRLVRTGREIGDFLFDSQLLYDNVDRLVQVVHPDGTALERDLDGAGRSTSIPLAGLALRYDERGLLSELSLGSHARTTYAYDALMRLAERAHLIDGAPLVHVALSRDRMGNVRQVDDRLDGTGPTGGADYTYDALYRLTGAELASTSVAQPEALSYAYDALGNVTHIESDWSAGSPRQLGALSYDDDNSSRLLEAGSLVYGYDARGRVVQRGTESYTYDALGRLTAVAVREERRAQYAYAIGDERVLVDDGATWLLRLSDGFELVNGVSVVRVGVADTAMALVESTDLAATLLGDPAPARPDGTPEGDGVFTVGDVWRAHLEELQDEPRSAGQPDVDQLLMGAARVLVAEADPGPYYYHRDPLGSVELTTNAAGAVIAEASIYPYGLIRGVTSSDPRDAEYAGIVREQGTALMQLGARWLDPVVGRFVAADPLFETMSPESPTLEAFGRYGYVQANPINAHDPTGLKLASLVADALGLYDAAGTAIDVASTADDLRYANCSNCALDGIEIRPPTWTEEVEIVARGVGSASDVIAGVAAVTASPLIAVAAEVYSIVETTRDIAGLGDPRDQFATLATGQLRDALSDVRRDLVAARRARDSAHQRTREIDTQLSPMGRRPGLDREALTRQYVEQSNARDQAGSRAFRRARQAEAIATELYERGDWLP